LFLPGTFTQCFEFMAKVFERLFSGFIHEVRDVVDNMFGCNLKVPWRVESHDFLQISFRVFIEKIIPDTGTYEYPFHTREPPQTPKELNLDILRGLKVVAGGTLPVNAGTITVP